MISLYLLLLTYKIVATAACALYAFWIARLPNSPSKTYYLFLTAFSFRLFTQIQGIFYTQDILGFLSGYSPWLIIESQVVEVIIVTCFLLGILSKYHVYKQLSFPHKRLGRPNE